MFRVGVIGATGFIGTPYRSQIREAAQSARLTCLCARRADLLEQAVALDNVTSVTQDWRDVVTHPEVDLVIVATPDALHHEAVMACAEAGKHLLCEKPIGANVREACEMWSAYRDSGLAHYVPYWTRYHPLFESAREIVRQGTLGDIRGIIYRWQNPRPRSMPLTWRDDSNLSSAGSIADVGSHAYDTLRWILGSEATRVLTFADVVTPAKPDLGEVNLQEALDWGNTGNSASDIGRRRGTAADFASIAFEMDNGAVGTMVVSHAFFLRKGLAPELELHGDEASLAIDRVRSTVTLMSANGDSKVVTTVENHNWGNRFEKHVFPAFSAMLAGEPSDHPNLEDGYRVQLFTDAAARSAREGHWITLNEIDPAREK